MEWILLIGRILFGGFFLMGGAMHFMNLSMMTEYARMKGAPSPKLSVALSGLVIMLAGLGVILGVFPDLSLLVLAAFLIVITPIMHAFWKMDDPTIKMLEMQHFLKNMALLGAALALYTLSSGWPLSLSL
ncbi:DoxX family protein [Candidatus Kaiserbacteria bacterium CG10_big_fil_rev_8_21_14_0_10_59_10]|uniref:DoxX family protein n=1 Tax=Candidatus Kaiserbacteria bacterium CG10_big_fil_rev_8_21_14_0_10_59_10 TaxID=1974612 RepID=A0A2H0U9C2_9BACT|nr:MAG: DoxX family protein [Candidatus Kaiserbacteria bacterium CG10_big_fil_rev_8_21_14_0_10_59_10]